MYLADIFTVPANIVGVPGISVPTGDAVDGLKYGVQFLTSDWNESKLFTIGYDLE
jgi:aspartyl-tRNA(Asn)/glutamyl-tRNA(Gln) amidotransferase subunit A